MLDYLNVNYSKINANTEDSAKGKLKDSYLEKLALLLSKNDTKGLDEKYNKNKEELQFYLSKVMIKTNNDKDFFKELFKVMDSYLNSIVNEEVFNKLGLYIDIPIITKTILFLKYRKTSNYRDKIKMIKELTNDLTLENLLFYEKYISDEQSSFEEKLADSKKYNHLKVSKESEISKEYVLKEHFLLFKNTILLLKCVLFNYHKRELILVENGKPKYKIVPIKNIYALDKTFKVDTGINLDYLIFLLNLMEKKIGKLIYHIDENITAMLLNTCLLDTLNKDDYNKFLLDKCYYEKVDIKGSTTSIYSFSISSTIFLQRKVLVPKNGLIILVEDEKSTIESILLSEQEFANYNHLYFVTRYKDGVEIINSVILSKDFIYNANIHVKDIEFDNKCQSTIAYIGKVLDLPMQYDNSKLKYNVISPQYWKYRNKNYISSNDKVDNKGVVVKREFKIEIAPFLRKINGEPSKDSLKLANKLGVILKKGYTIVKPHTRTYNKVK